MSTTQELEAPPETFLAPYVPIGHPVRWYAPHRANQKWYPAVVLRKNADDSLCLAVFRSPEDGQAGRLDFRQVSALHKDDKRIYEDARKRYGSWDLSPGDKAQRKLHPEYVDLLKEFA